MLKMLGVVNDDNYIIAWGGELHTNFTKAGALYTQLSRPMPGCRRVPNGRSVDYQPTPKWPDCIAAVMFDARSPHF
jgi:hypothetical protein